MAGAWGPPRVVPGIASLDRAGIGGASTTALSCPIRRWCGAGGIYIDGSLNQQAFVLAGGVDAAGTAVEVPGLAALNMRTNGYATLTSLSCGAPGDCAAGGSYLGAPGVATAWVDTERDGTWGTAVPVAESTSVSTPMSTATSFTGPVSTVTSVSCVGTASCTAVGQSQAGLPFVVTETEGTWAVANGVPGIGALGPAGSLTSVSCTGPGECAAAGWVGPVAAPGSPGAGQVFVVDEVGGTWGAADELPGVHALNVGNAVTAPMVSCGASGVCAAAGTYTDARLAMQVFVATASHGRWSTGRELAGSRALNGGGWATLSGLECRSSACTLTAQMALHVGRGSVTVPVVASARSGSWGAAERLLGEPAFSAAVIEGLACWGPASCSVIGRTLQATPPARPVEFAAAELGGAWTDARPIATPTAFDRLALASSEVQSMACGAPSACVAGGFERAVAKQRQLAFLIVETPPPIVTRLSRSSGPAAGGTTVVIYGRDLSDATAVDFGRVRARFQVLNADAVRAVSPAGRGPVEVAVTTPGGTSVAPHAARYTYLG